MFVSTGKYFHIYMNTKSLFHYRWVKTLAKTVEEKIISFNQFIEEHERALKGLREQHRSVLAEISRVKSDIAGAKAERHKLIAEMGRESQGVCWDEDEAACVDS